MADLLKLVCDSGFPFPDRLIHLFVGGSELHGAKVHGADDLDIYGVYIEPPEMVLGLESLPHFVWSTAGDDRPNGPHDVDITLYSLRKWAGLACKGNPTALHFLFAQGVLRNEMWSQIVAHRNLFAARSFVKQFTGFANDQLARVTGKKGRGRKGQRPDLEAQYGYDVKAGMHSLRLLYECREFIADRKITLPRPERDFLIRVRTGKYPVERVVRIAGELLSECESLADKSKMPEKLDRRAISHLLSQCYLNAWEHN